MRGPTLTRACLVLTLLAACGDGGTTAADAAPADGGAPGDAGSASLDARGPSHDGGCAQGFATSVEAVSYGTGAGFGQSKMPMVVLGPPQGGGAGQGSLDVVSLGMNGQIVLGFAGDGIADGPGADFIVFENPFVVGSGTFDELAEVSVSDDQVSWTTFPCQRADPPFAGCAGKTPVYSNPANAISPFDPGAAGGDAYDLATVGRDRARFVRIRDLAFNGAGTSAGFDLDAVSVIHPSCD